MIKRMVHPHLPQYWALTLLCFVIRPLLRLLYRVGVDGLEHIPTPGTPVLVIANHVSLLDAVLLVAFLPMRLSFAINIHFAKRWWIRPLRCFAPFFIIDPANPMAAREMIHALQEGQACAIFPEGRLTVTGGLMKIYDGAALIADKSKAVLLPVHIDGAQYSSWAYFRCRAGQSFFPRIRLTALAPRRLFVPETVTGHERRKALTSALHDLMMEMQLAATPSSQTLTQALLTSAHLCGWHAPLAEDASRTVVTPWGLVLKSAVLANVLRDRLPANARVGLMLPTTLAAVHVFFALHRIGKIPAMVNFTSGATAVISGCRTVNLCTVLTSRRFLQEAHLETLSEALRAHKIQVILLEDLLSTITLTHKIVGLQMALTSVWHSHKSGTDKKNTLNPSPHDPAVILFTSGSEGTPKAIFLSHYNILSNHAQLLSMLAVNSHDRFFCCLPMFHAFGLCTGVLLPLLNGMRVFLYPSPLHYQLIPELVYDSQSTVLLGTDTFFYGFGRAAHPHDFYSLHFAIAGGERLKKRTSALWAEKFGIHVFEGYGATETSPVIAVNTPLHHRSGTVGRLVPGLVARLMPIEGVEGERLVVHGPNVMLGVMRAARPNTLEPPIDQGEPGWHDTGDVVQLDDEGFVTIKGRAKRFAKISGEMVSLTAVENAVDTLWPNALQGVVALRDDRKGEKLVLVTEYKEATVSALTTHFKSLGLSLLHLPRSIVVVDKAPVLGSGKFDWGTALHLAKLAENSELETD